MHDPMAPSPSVDVLIAEEEPHLWEVLRAVLEEKGYRCNVAANGPAAVARARQLPPLLVFLDLAKPGSDSLSVARQLRADPQTRHLHILRLSDRTDAKTRRQAQQAGCEMFMTKPLDGSVL